MRRRPTLSGSKLTWTLLILYLALLLGFVATAVRVSPAMAQSPAVGEPRQVECVGRITTEMTLRWSEPSSGTAASYNVRYKTAAEAGYTELNAAGANHLLAGLTPDTEYAVGVRAVAGDSTTSDWVDESCGTPQTNPIIDLSGVAETLPGGKMTAVFIPALIIAVVMLAMTKQVILSFGAGGLVLVVSLFMVEANPLLLAVLLPIVGAGFIYGRVLR